MKKFKKVFLLFIYVMTFCFVIIFGLNFYIIKSTSAKIFSTLGTLPHANTVIILGASVHSDGRLSAILQDRVDTGLFLYENGKVDRFLLSGDNREADYDEVSAMRNYLLKLNVPAEHILVDPAGIDTYDSMSRSSAVFNIPSAIVVTQNFHLPRTLFIAQNLGMDYMGFVARPNKYQTEPKLLRREKLANFKAAFELLFSKLPTHTVTPTTSSF